MLAVSRPQEPPWWLNDRNAEKWQSRVNGWLATAFLANLRFAQTDGLQRVGP